LGEEAVVEAGGRSAPGIPSLLVECLASVVREKPEEKPPALSQYHVEYSWVCSLQKLLPAR
jgi:hypothetical protein